MTLHEAIQKVAKSDVLKSGNRFEVYLDGTLTHTITFDQLKEYNVFDGQYIKSIDRYPMDPVYRVNLYTDALSHPDPTRLGYGPHKEMPKDSTPNSFIPKQGCKVQLLTGGPTWLVCSNVGNEHVITVCCFLYSEGGYFTEFLHRKLPTCLFRAV